MSALTSTRKGEVLLGLLGIVSFLGTGKPRFWDSELGWVAADPFPTAGSYLPAAPSKVLL